MPPLNCSPHLRFGANGEKTAAAILQNNGYAILARNWRFGKLEIDLVCERLGEIVFVEVKTRHSSSCGGGAGAITAAKKRRLMLAAQAWLVKHGLWDKPCRFDVVCLTGEDGNFRMEHYCNAFELTETLDCRHANWQPW